MKTWIKNIYVLAAVLSLGSCVKDDTVESFSELNKVTFGEMDEKYSVMLYDTLQIPLDITTSFNDESQLSYAWYIYTRTSSFKADTLSHEKNLNVVIDPTKAIPGEDYTLGVKVTDESTGVYYRKDMKLEVTTLFTKGTIMLCKENNNIELNFLTNEKNRKLIDNVYSRSNGGEQLTGTPTHVYSINPNNYAPFMKQVLIFCDNEDGGVILDPITFEKIKPLRNAFESKLSSTTLYPQAYMKPQMSIDYIILDGKICKRGVNMKRMDWEAPLVCTQGSGDYEVAPFFWEIDYQGTFYDRKNKRILQHFRWNMGALHQLSLAGADLSHFNPNEIGENMEMLCSGNLSGINQCWMLMKNSETGKLYIYKFQVWKGRFISKLKMELTTKAVPHINEAVAFAVNPNFRDVLMFSTKDKVFSFSVNLLNAYTDNILEACQVDLSDKNMEITGLEFQKINVDSPTGGKPIASNQLRLYVKDHNLSGLQGGVMFYEVSSMGGLHSELLYSKTGFCDEVVDIEEKYN